MKLSQIRQIARGNELINFFKELYRHSLELLESIPDDEIIALISLNQTGHPVEDWVRCYCELNPEAEESDLIDQKSYQFMIPNGIALRKDNYNSSVLMELEYAGIRNFWDDAENIYPRKCDDLGYILDDRIYKRKNIAIRRFKDVFDYKFLRIIFYLGYDEIGFEILNYDNATQEQKAFIECLTDEMFLKCIFGNDIIQNSSEGFIVSGRFFEK